MAYLRNIAVQQKHFDDVKANFYRRILKQSQVVKGATGQPEALSGINGGGGASPCLGGPSFYLHERKKNNRN